MPRTRAHEHTQTACHFNERALTNRSYEGLYRSGVVCTRQLSNERQRAIGDTPYLNVAQFVGVQEDSDFSKHGQHRDKQSKHLSTPSSRSSSSSRQTSHEQASTAARLGSNLVISNVKIRELENAESTRSIGSDSTKRCSCVSFNVASHAMATQMDCGQNESEWRWWLLRHQYQIETIREGHQFNLVD